MNKAALIIFAKAPVPGEVKTRLALHLGDARAARLYRAFLEDALAQYSTSGVDIRLYISPGSTPFPEELKPPEATLYVQRGRGLGDRMQHALLETFASGYGRAVIIGTDHPSLPSEFVQLAFESLEEPLSVCIGPSDDGGYYLIGMNDLFPSAFAGMTYSHPDVFTQTLARLEDTNASVTVLPSWYDVDDADSLNRLIADLRCSSATAPRTAQLLHTLHLLN